MPGRMWRSFRDTVLIGGLAACLTLAFTTGLAGARDPNYVLQRHVDESYLDLAPTVDCETLERIPDWSLEGSSSDDWQLRRDVWRAQRLLDCDD